MMTCRHPFKPQDGNDEYCVCGSPRRDHIQQNNNIRQSPAKQKAEEALRAILSRVALVSPYYEMAREALTLLEAEECGALFTKQMVRGDAISRESNGISEVFFSEMEHDL